MSSAPAVASPAPPLVSRVRKLHLRDKLVSIGATTGCTFISYFAMMANAAASQAIVDSGVCVPSGSHSPDGSLLAAAALAGCAMLCAAVASYRSSQILFSAEINDRARSRLGQLAQMLALGVLFSGLAYDRTTAAFDRRQLATILQGIVSFDASAEAKAVRFTGWAVLASVFGMATVIRLMYSRTDKPGTAFAQVGHAMTDKFANTLLGKKTAEQKLEKAKKKAKPE